MGRYRAVIFDVGGVLLDSPFHAAVAWQREKQLPEAALELMFAEYSRLPEPGEPLPAWHRVERGELALQAFIDEMAERLEGRPGATNPLRGLLASEFDVFAGAGPIPAMHQLVERLDARGLLLGVLTNNVREWAAWRAKLPLERFDDLVDSCEVGLRKPDPAIFELALDRLGVAAGETIFCDDHPDNVAAARRLGLTGVLVTDDQQEAVDEIEALVARRA